MDEAAEPKRPDDGMPASGGEPAAGIPGDNLGFADFSKAFDEVGEARKALEKFGTARLDNPRAPEVVAAQMAFVHAVKRYDAIVAALIKPKF
jgi:hypothetical protein